MIGGRGVNVHTTDVMFAQKIDCKSELIAYDPVAISELDCELIIEQLLDQRLELAQVMFSRRERRRKLQQKYAEFSGRLQDRHRPQKRFEKRILQFWRRVYLLLCVDLGNPLQLRGQQFSFGRMKRKELMQLDVESETVRRGGAPTFHHSRVGHRIKGRIDLDHREMLRIPGEPFVSRHFLRIPTLDKSGIGPARSADQNVTAIFLRRTRRRHLLTETPRPKNANFR